VGIVLSGVFLTNSVEKHDNIQIIKGLLLVESTIKIAGPLHPATATGGLQGDQGAGGAIARHLGKEDGVV
jgi:hypothetical protein